MNNYDQYFATLETDELGAEIINKVRSYNDYLLASGKASLWEKSFNNYYAGGIKFGELERAGEQGEFTMMSINHYKSLLNNLVTITASNKPAFDPRATNTDTESIAQTKLASGLLDYYLREKKVDRFLKASLRHALTYGEGFLLTEWNPTGGKDYGVNPDTGATVREGDLDFKSFQPHFVARDFTKISGQEQQWVVTTTFENKYNLAYKYPELEDRIKCISLDNEVFMKLRLTKSAFAECDDIAVYTFYHKPCDILPEGRMVQVLDADLVIFDGPLPYRDIPLRRLSPEDEDFSIFGYTVAYDLLAIQEAVNSLYSIVITNQATFGVQNILIPRGFNISVNTLTGGLNLVEYDPKLGKPEPLQLTMTAPEIYNFIGQLEKLMETLSGVNSVARGNPEASLKSGAALALVQSMAIQFNSGLQQSYMQLSEDVGTDIINILKDFAAVPRVAVIAGKYNRSYMKEFSGKDLSQINRVVVDSGNPLSKTLAGKTQLAETLLQAGFIKNAEQYMTVLTTGNLETMLEGQQMELYQIKQENEMMAEGMEVFAVVTDSHAMHIQEHKAVLSSPESRNDPVIVQAVTKHLMEHIQLLKTADPVLLQILGQEPVQAQPQEGQAGSVPAVEGAPMGVGPQGPTPTAEALPVENPVTNEVAQVNPARMPTNPLTGEQAPDPRQNQ